MNEVCHHYGRNASAEKPHKYRGITIVNQTATSGVQVLSTRRQSIPSRSIESWARVRCTVPLSAFGQINRPRSKRLYLNQECKWFNRSNGFCSGDASLSSAEWASAGL